MNTDELCRLLIERGQEWVRAQRERYRADGSSLSEADEAHYAAFFENHILDSVRITQVPLIENPEFYRDISPMEIQLLDFCSMSAITFKDTILISTSRGPRGTDLKPLLFHELVHVVQYHVLNVFAFVEQYVRGWVEGGFNYHAIPLERDAYDLETRYRADPYHSFSVIAEIRHRLGSR